MKVRITQIPDRYRPGIDILVSLTDEQFSESRRALDQAPPALRTTGLISSIGPLVPSIDENDLEEIIEALVSLYMVRESFRLTDEDLVTSITDIISTRDYEPQHAPEAVQRFRTRCIELLGYNGNLGVAAKAIEVLIDHEHAFCRARILTDMRPVFHDRVEDGPAAFVIVHNLKIQYHEGVQHKEFFVALDTSDIRSLRTLLDRADKKASSLKATLTDKNVPYLDADGEETT